VSTSGDASSRLSSALEQILSRGRADERPDAPTTPNEVPTDEPVAADWSVDDEPTRASAGTGVDEPYRLPEIVPATVDAPSADAEVWPTQPVLPTVGRTAPPGPPPTSVAPTPRAPEPARASGWTDFVGADAVATGPQLRAPGRRPRVRRVTRVLRHIDPWSTFKVALVFSAVGYVVVLTAGVLLWRVADSTGTLDNVERWFTQFGWETFELDGSEVFQNAWIIGLFGVVAATGGLVLMATLFNLVSDIVGGVRLTVLEEEVVERTQSSTRRYVVRRTPSGLTGDTAPTWDVDDEPAAPPPSPAAPPTADWSVD
jgi:hypothetical protein